MHTCAAGLKIICRQGNLNAAGVRGVFLVPSERNAVYIDVTESVESGGVVAVLRGEDDVRGTEGKVVEVFTKTGRVSIEGVTIKQADGTAVARPIHASNLVITKLNLEDSLRAEALGKKKEAAE